MSSRNKGNIITMGINLESQLLAIKKFIEKEKKKKTVILYPKNEYAKYVEKNIKVINFTNTRLFSYSKDPKVLTKQIEKLTNYKQRKINLESRIKKLEGSEDPKDLRELNRLKQKYTLGKVNFDSVVIIDFGDGLKSVLTSLAYTDVSEKDILKSAVSLLKMQQTKILQMILVIHHCILLQNMETLKSTNSLLKMWQTKIL